MAPEHSRRQDEAELIRLINCALLKSKVQLIIAHNLSGTEEVHHVELAMFHAVQALEAAALSHHTELEAKAEMFRGHCYRKLEKWADAHRSYIRAAALPSFAADKGPEGLESLTRECIRKNLTSTKHPVL